MSQRLINLRQIREEKIARSPAWIYERIATGSFPKPLPLNGTSKNLWDESEVDRWLADFIAQAKASGESANKRTAKAGATRSTAAQVPGFQGIPTRVMRYRLAEESRAKAVELLGGVAPATT